MKKQRDCLGLWLKAKHQRARNLSNHFNNHVNREETKFLQSLRESVGIYEPTAEEAQIIIEKIKKNIDADES